MYDFISIEFWGAAQEVTGSKHLITAPDGTKILLDCGLLQGANSEDANRHFGFNPKEIDVLVVSHAHIDHSGNIPNLVKQGFRGKILTTAATIDVLSIMLADSARIQEDDAEYINKKRKAEGRKPIQPLYTIEDVEMTLKMFHAVRIKEHYQWNENISFYFTDAGHILGSAVINLTIKDKAEKNIHLTFTGDVGKYNDMLLKNPEPFPQADYIICESTYGDRLHEVEIDAEIHLLNVVRKTCIEKKGKLIIPAFSLGRTQEIVFILDKLKNNGLLPNIKVYVDSPLSANVTDIMRNNVSCFNEKLQNYIKTDPDPFGFSNLTYIRDKEESMALNTSKEPCIILSASGMMDAGRIKHHLKNNISDAKNTILVVGYCTPHSLGGKIKEGQNVVKIFGEEYDVNAEVEVIDSYSAHADYNELMKFLSCQDKIKLKKLFLVHGDIEAKLSFKEKLHVEGYKDIVIPNKHEIFHLD